MTAEELVKAVREGRAEPVDLWLKLKRYAWKVANKYSGNDKELHDDLMQESYLALLSALEHFDGSSSFINYYTLWLRSYFVRYNDPCRVAARVRRYRRAGAAFERDNGRAPSDDEIREAIGCDPEAVRREAQVVDALSLDYPVDDEGEATFADLVEDHAADVEGQVIEQLNQEELSKKLWSLVDDLPERQADTIRKRYKDGKTLKECGEDFDLSLQSVRRIESQAIRKLRSKSITKQLEPFLDGLRYSIGVGAGFDPTARAAEKAVKYLEKLKEEGLL